MKLTPLQSSLAVSVGVHALAFGVASWSGMLRQEATFQHEPPPLMVNLVAAPAEPAIVTEATIAPIAPPVEAATPAATSPPVLPPLSKPEMIPDPATLPEIPPMPVLHRPEPQPAPVNVTPIPVPVPVAASIASAPARGDASSLQPGADTTTTKAQPGILARPDYKKNPEPVYPPLARRRGLEGAVILEVRVSVQGRASDISVKESSGHALLDEAALKAVRDWEFEPARVGALPVESRIEVPVRFKLAR